MGTTQTTEQHFPTDVAAKPGASESTDPAELVAKDLSRIASVKLRQISTQRDRLIGAYEDLEQKVREQPAGRPQVNVMLSSRLLKAERLLAVFHPVLWP